MLCCAALKCLRAPKSWAIIAAMNRKSKVWWIPLARRVLGWGAAGALLWALPVAALIASVAIYVYLQPSPLMPSDGFGISGDGLLLGLLFWLGVISSSIFAAMGALTGGFAAFYAPATDARNPLKSHFFRSFGRRTFWFTATTSLACGLTLGVVSYAGFGFLLPFVGWLVISGALFFLGLWRAVNRALAEATASNCNA